MKQIIVIGLGGYFGFKINQFNERFFLQNTQTALPDQITHFRIFQKSMNPTWF
jgi:hypothetical protein